MGNDKNIDGGYYAIKGFLYQFDKTLIEVLQHPQIDIQIEHKQDMDYQDYVIQVKHKETQEYSPSKIRKPIIQLLELFKSEQTQKFCLYCHFKNKEPQQWAPSISELDQILSTDKDKYSNYLKQDFLQNLIIQFSEDFTSQFEQLIDMIKLKFSLENRERAFIYHSIFRSKLFDISIKSIEDRKVSRSVLSDFINDVESTIFYDSYSNYIEIDQFNKIIKKEYFTFRKANIDNFERLIIIDCNKGFDLITTSQIVNLVSKKYFVKNKSPQPFICFSNVNNENLIALKRELIDQKIIFNDGTYFNGDRFRLDKILEDDSSNEEIKIKIIDESNLGSLQKKHKFKELFQFYNDTPIPIESNYRHIKIQIKEINQITKMLG